jgi:hypothetical protein
LLILTFIVVFCTNVFADPIPYIVIEKPEDSMLLIKWLSNDIPEHSIHYKDLRIGNFNDDLEMYREVTTCLFEMYVNFLLDCLEEGEPWGDTEADHILDKYEIDIKAGYISIPGGEGKE